MLKKARAAAHKPRLNPPEEKIRGIVKDYWKPCPVPILLHIMGIPAILRANTLSTWEKPQRGFHGTHGFAFAFGRFASEYLSIFAHLPLFWGHPALNSIIAAALPFGGIAPESGLCGDKAVLQMTICRSKSLAMSPLLVKTSPLPAARPTCRRRSSFPLRRFFFIKKSGCVASRRFLAIFLCSKHIGNSPGFFDAGFASLLSRLDKGVSRKETGRFLPASISAYAAALRFFRALRKLFTTAYTHGVIC